MIDKIKKNASNSPIQLMIGVHFMVGASNHEVIWVGLLQYAVGALSLLIYGYTIKRDCDDKKN